MPGAVFAGHLDGFLRAYAESDGRLLWEYDTKVAAPGVNGVEARGGGMSGGGPAIGDGHVVVNSGYGLYFHMPGNALLVFAPPE
jgi:polyvinyl alcohol dehydrogenase (cytochrome)